MATASQAPAGTELQKLARDHLWMHFSRMGAYDADHEIPIIARAEGCHVYDDRGKRYLDTANTQVMPAYLDLDP